MVAQLRNGCDINQLQRLNVCDSVALGIKQVKKQHPAESTNLCKKIKYIKSNKLLSLEENPLSQHSNRTQSNVLRQCQSNYRT